MKFKTVALLSLIALLAGCAWLNGPAQTTSAVVDTMVFRQLSMKIPAAGSADSAVVVRVMETVDFTSADSLIIQLEALPGQAEVLAKTILPAGGLILQRTVASPWIDETDSTGGRVLGDFSSQTYSSTGQVVQLPAAVSALNVLRVGDAFSINGVRYDDAMAISRLMAPIQIE